MLSVNIERLDYSEYLKNQNTETAEDTTILTDIREEDTVNTENSSNIKIDISTVDCKLEDIKDTEWNPPKK